MVRDVRPPDKNADSAYPVDTITSIMEGAQTQRAQFVVGTGGYMFSDTTSSVSRQLDTLLQAEASFSGQVFHCMGNHECTGATAGNCTSTDQTPNLQGFMQKLVPFSTLPYFSVTLQTSLGSAKFVVIAANFWTPDQETWLRQQLAIPTTYTFVVRHEAPNGHGNSAPGVAPSDAIIAQFPVTLKLFGHSHTYERLSTNAVISGNGGAPLTSAVSFGYLMVRQLASGNIAVTEFEQGTNTPVDTWTVTPAGAAAN
jgi:hypothetical protein